MNFKENLKAGFAALRQCFKYCAALVFSACKRTKISLIALWNDLRIRRWFQRANERYWGRLKSLVSALAVGCLVYLVALGVLFLGFHRVSPGTIAVRQVNWGSAAGIQPQDYKSGLHFGWSGLNAWHELPAGTEVVSFGTPESGAKYPTLEVLTSEGNTSNVAVNVPYRIKPGEGHRIISTGLHGTYRTQVKSAVEKVLLAEIANLTSADFASTDRRLEACASALSSLRPLLDPLHVEAESVLISSSFFPPAYEAKMQERQLESQEIKTEAKLYELSSARAERDAIEREISQEENRLRDSYDAQLAALSLANDEAISKASSESAAYVKLRQGLAQAEHDKLLAEGKEGLDRSLALREELHGKLMESVGGRLYLARQAAINLRFKSITLDPSDPMAPSIFDLDQLVNRLTGE
ncbi:MAG: hypothetical protein ACI8X5_003680 [Planctomycetota bacterium]|jgi:hypothetical protein